MHQPLDSSHRNSLRLLTLNLAHGRKDGPNQVFRSRAAIQRHLSDVAALIRHHRPEVVALQEADGPCVWSGNFDHVRHVAQEAAYHHTLRGEHVRRRPLSYGTAIISDLPLQHRVSRRFRSSRPTPRKGFVCATVEWPGAPGKRIDIVSVHLDFLRRRVRERQILELVAHQRTRSWPMAILGDFNCEWRQRRSALRLLAEELDLHTFQPESDELGTFPLTGRRIDWILISRELEFRSFEVLPDVVSDHRAALAEVEPTKRSG